MLNALQSEHTNSDHFIIKDLWGQLADRALHASCFRMIVEYITWFQLILEFCCLKNSGDHSLGCYGEKCLKKLSYFMNVPITEQVKWVKEVTLELQFIVFCPFKLTYVNVTWSWLLCRMVIKAFHWLSLLVCIHHDCGPIFKRIFEYWAIT